jgi:hypothetical protein
MPKGQNRYIQMTPSPCYSDIQGSSLRLDDVNGDGLPDLVQIRYTDVDIYLNVDGTGWTERHIIRGSPATPSYTNRVRLVDINGSGTPDILWGDAERYQYIDLQGGTRPWLLTKVDNGLGKTTDIQYSTSTAEMLEAERSGSSCQLDKSNPTAAEAIAAAGPNPWAKKWCTKMPTVTDVVKRVTENGNITVAGKPPYTYITERLSV